METRQPKIRVTVRQQSNGVIREFDRSVVLIGPGPEFDVELYDARLEQRGIAIFDVEGQLKCTFVKSARFVGVCPNQGNCAALLNDLGISIALQPGSVSAKPNFSLTPVSYVQNRIRGGFCVSILNAQFQSQLPYRLLNDHLTLIGGRRPSLIKLPSSDSAVDCALIHSDGRVRIEALNPSSHVFVNDQSVLHSDLRVGDRFRVGPVHFELQKSPSPEVIDSDQEVASSELAPVGGDSANSADLSKRLLFAIERIADSQSQLVHEAMEQRKVLERMLLRLSHEQRERSQMDAEQISLLLSEIRKLQDQSRGVAGLPHQAPPEQTVVTTAPHHKTFPEDIEAHKSVEEGLLSLSRNSSPTLTQLLSIFKKHDSVD